MFHYTDLEYFRRKAETHENPKFREKYRRLYEFIKGSRTQRRSMLYDINKDINRRKP